jgi:predicted NUDIX family NTP pyrophosphohydrolase
MPRTSAGILPFRFDGDTLQVLLVHPGGPYWACKDAGAWSIPKGEHGPGDDPLEAALRELAEETGADVAASDRGALVELGVATQKGGKVVSAWAAELDLDASAVESNTFTLEWPPRSGRQQAFPEVDRAAWLDLETARTKINPGQAAFLDRLERALALRRV